MKSKPRRPWIGKLVAVLAMAGAMVCLAVVDASLHPISLVWPVILYSADFAMAFLIVVATFSMLIDRAVEQVRASGGLEPEGTVGAKGARVQKLVLTPGGIARRRELAYKTLKADMALLSSEGVLSQSFSEIAADMNTAGHGDRFTRRLITRACEEGVLKPIKGKDRYSIVAAAKKLPDIKKLVQSSLDEVK
nr:hypothetical protein [Candidatus Sigynarchaeota archaeon]